MKLKDAKNALEPLLYKPFETIFSPDDLQYIIRNKGKSGQLLEVVLGLKNSSAPLDFEDGELKTNKCNIDGKPKETIFICQIASIIDDLLSNKNFYQTHLFEKIKNILYVPICKEGQPKDWMFLQYYHINLEEPKYAIIKQQLENDYYTICSLLNNHINASGYIHTSNGQYIQIRSKDKKPYTPIFSSTYDKNISNKNHAFYFKKDFINYIKSV